MVKSVLKNSNFFPNISTHQDHVISPKPRFEHALPMHAKNKIKTSKVPILCIEIQFKNNNNDEIKKTIELSSDKYNYDVKGNQICSQFIDYFVHTHHPDWIEEHQLVLPFQYTMNIVDSNINEITLTDEDILLLKTTE